MEKDSLVSETTPDNMKETRSSRRSKIELSNLQLRLQIASSSFRGLSETSPLKGCYDQGRCRQNSRSGSLAMCMRRKLTGWLIR
jgi:hypothetical protein